RYLACGDHRDALDEHPVPGDADVLDSIVHEDRGAELQLVLGEERFARLRREGIDLPLRVVPPESLHDLPDTTLLVSLNGRDERDGDHRFRPAYGRNTHKVCAQAPTGEKIGRASCRERGEREAVERV